MMAMRIPDPVQNVKRNELDWTEALLGRDFGPGKVAGKCAAEISHGWGGKCKSRDLISFDAPG